MKLNLTLFDGVASLAEAWIEITVPAAVKPWLESPPSRRRGLKYLEEFLNIRSITVASLAEAWIEIVQHGRSYYLDSCRLPRGGVD